jgi:hypothetical protein
LKLDINSIRGRPGVLKRPARLLIAQNDGGNQMKNGKNFGPVTLVWQENAGKILFYQSFKNYRRR